MSDNNLVISVDAMGGDNSPHVVVEGIAIAHKSNPDIKFLLFGDEVQIEEDIKKFPQLRDFCKVIHTSERVRNEDKPVCIWLLTRCAAAKLVLLFLPATQAL